jgi:teichuronic acid biosynthesis glycosyltransferase TuaC
MEKVPSDIAEASRIRSRVTPMNLGIQRERAVAPCPDRHGTDRPLRILTFTTLYPNDVMPSQGIFVETRLRHLVASGAVESMVVAPVPWFPWRHPRFGQYARYAAVASREVRFGIDVRHPRFLRIPKIGMTSAPFLLASAVLPVIRRIFAAGYDFDLIDAHYFYPDGVAAALVGRALKRPVVITARGSDVMVIPRYAVPRRLIVRAASSSAAVITVSRSLKDQLAQLNVPAERMIVLRNGVDLDLFRPADRTAARATFGMSGFVLASVGNLVALKGHDLVIRALAAIPDAQLVIAGQGPELGNLRALAARSGAADRVRFLGSISQQSLRSLYSAADCLVLASSSEGWPNVLLEAMACGTPVIAARVSGIPEVVTSAEAGLLFDERTPESIADAVARLRSSPPDRAATRRYAERFSWNDTTRGQIALFGDIVAADRRLAECRLRQGA